MTKSTGAHRDHHFLQMAIRSRLNAKRLEGMPALMQSAVPPASWCALRRQASRPCCDALAMLLKLPGLQLLPSLPLLPPRPVHAKNVNDPLQC